MVAMERIRLFALNKRPCDNLELIEILPALSCFLNVSFELPGIDRGSHLDSKLSEHVIRIFANQQVLAGIRTFECPSRARIRNNYIERKPLAQRDLSVEKSDGLCGREP
jgi:hypothetical protein